nr:7TM domain-containing protein [Myxococcota bacterium]
AIFRNGIGINTYGTFLPALVALALREQPLGRGVLLLAIVVGVALLIRAGVERLRLLMVPRLSIVLSVVVLVLVGVALVSTGEGAGRMLSGAILPVVILSMLVERIHVVAEEEGLREAMVRLVGTLVIAGAVLPIFKSPVAEHLMFTFPELVIGIIGLLIWIGGYTGYRLSELVRFRSLAREEEA